MTELEELKSRLFMLNMKDYWSADDYRMDRELSEKIKKIEEEDDDRK